mmetsp:Transcript_29774/g.72549  ORF Transcript_29774/g.72549 Transcript_29774/m.72549 type:complete len:266 (+) Transcript_29774:684-1481(+)
MTELSIDNRKTSSFYFLKFDAMIDSYNVKQNSKKIFSNEEIKKITNKFSVYTFNKKRTSYQKNTTIEIENKKIKETKVQSRLIQIRKKAVFPDLIEYIDAKSTSLKIMFLLKHELKSISIPSHWKSKKKYLIGNKNTDREKYKMDGDIKILTDKKILGLDEFKLLKSYFYNVKNRYKKYLDFGEYLQSFNSKTFSRTEIMRGFISPELRDALGITLHSLPPWVTNFSRFGTPPTVSIDLTQYCVNPVRSLMPKHNGKTICKNWGF